MNMGNPQQGGSLSKGKIVAQKYHTSARLSRPLSSTFTGVDSWTSPKTARSGPVPEAVRVPRQAARCHDTLTSLPRNR